MKPHYLKKGSPRGRKKLTPNVGTFIQEALDSIDRYSLDINENHKTMVVAFTVPYEIKAQGEMIDQLVTLPAWMASYFSSMDYSLNNSYYDWVQAYVLDEYAEEIDPDMLMTVISEYENIFFRWLNNSAPELLKFHIVYSDIFDVIYDYTTDTFYAIVLLNEDNTLWEKYRSQALSFNLENYRPTNFVKKVETTEIVSNLAATLRFTDDLEIGYEANP